MPFIQDAHTIVQKELKEIYELANQVYEWYLEEFELEYRGDVKVEQKPRYYLSVKMKEYSVEMYWKEINFGKEGTKWTRRNQYVKLGKLKSRYDLSQFKKAPDWQKEAIEQVEEKLASLRMRSRAMVRMMRTAAGYERTVVKFGGELKQWIEEQNKS